MKNICWISNHGRGQLFRNFSRKTVFWWKSEKVIPWKFEISAIFLQNHSASVPERDFWGPPLGGATLLPRPFYTWARRDSHTFFFLLYSFLSLRRFFVMKNLGLLLFLQGSDASKFREISVQERSLCPKRLKTLYCLIPKIFKLL